MLLDSWDGEEVVLTILSLDCEAPRVFYDGQKEREE